MKLQGACLLLVSCCLAVGAAMAEEASLNPRRLIVESSGFLGKQEPAMSESEQAVYDKIAPILANRPAFGLKLLKAMSTSSDPDAKPSPAFEFMAGNAYYAAGHYSDAEARYRSAVERNPSFIRAWSNLGVLYYEQSRYADAASCFSKAVTLGDRDPTTFGLLGNSFEKSGNAVSAEMAYMQALAAEPENASWTEGVLRIYIAGKQHAKAETLVRTLLTNHPQDVRYWQTYVHVLLSAGRKLEAMALLERMSATGLAREADLILLGDLYAGQGMTPEALTTFGRVAETQAELVEQRLLQFAKTLSGQRAWADALTVLDALSQTRLTAQGRIVCLETRAVLEIGRQNWIEAKKAFEALIAADPANGNAWIGLGRVHLAEAEPDKAIGAFERAYQIPGSAYRASIELTNIEFKNHNYERCLRYLEHALSLQRSAAVENFRDQIKRLMPEEKTLNL